MLTIDEAEKGFVGLPERYEQEKFHPKISLNSDYVHNTAMMRERIKASTETRIAWIQDSSDGVFSEYLIDSTIRIESLAKSFSQHQKNFWEHLKGKRLSERNMSAALLIGAVLFSYNSNHRIQMIACAIIGLFGFAWNQYQANNAEQQAQSWSQSPVLEAAKEREKAYQEGFCYAYSNNLKNAGVSRGILHPLEVKTFYEEYFPQFFQTMLNKEALTPLEQLQWVGNFCKMNPISSPFMIYGLGEIPEHLKEVAQECDQFISEMQSSKIPPKAEVYKIYNRAREILLKGELALKNRPAA